ncbi:hypothetical protein ACIB24_03740 [Spongisporangium articulatum]|uniref:Uncharacterized protein n=1 Tax=Spongisporangium articulatum TaxID=3362603 RepID=A0ABW8AIH4_9ACTN
MTLRRTRTPGRRARALVALAAVGLAAPLLAAAGAQTASGATTGAFYVLRSQATGNPASAADNAKCDSYLGTPRKYLTLQRLDATLNAPVVSTASGELTNGTAVPVTPAYLCAALPGDGGVVQSYARTTLPTIGAVELAGPCNPSLAAAQLGTALVDCRLNVLSAPAGFSGVGQTNSIDNPFNGPGAQTGSLISAYVTGPTTSDSGTPAAAAPATVNGAKFYVLRATSSTTSTGLSACPSGWKGRVSTLKAAQVASDSGRVLAPTGGSVGSLTTCYASASTSGKVSAKAALTLTSTGRTYRSEGDCTQTALAATPGTVVQTCGLVLRAPVFTVEDGLLTGTLTVPSGAAAETVDAGVWSFTDLT